VNRGSGAGRVGGLIAYYLATPLFLIPDLGFDAPIRVAGLAGTEWRFAYYAFGLGCGFVCRWKPRWTPAVTIGESSVNLFLLILSVLLPIWVLPDQIAAGGAPEFVFGPVQMANVLLTGTVLLVGFYRAQAHLTPASKRRRRR
jgi:hypothetical protein